MVVFWKERESRCGMEISGKTSRLALARTSKVCSRRDSRPCDGWKRAAEGLERRTRAPDSTVTRERIESPPKMPAVGLMTLTRRVAPSRGIVGAEEAQVAAK
jgi:hypothetical protein